MPEAQLRIADEFVYDLAAITSPKVLDQIRSAVRLLSRHPEMGSPNVRKSLRKAFGNGLRKLPVSTFVVIYRYEDGIVDVLACVYGPRIR